MAKERKVLDHGMLLDAKYVMDLGGLFGELEELVPEILHDQLRAKINQYESELAECDVASRYVEKQEALDLAKGWKDTHEAYVKALCAGERHYG